MALNLNEIFKSTNLKGIISIDDTWNFNKDAESCLSDIYNLPIHDRECLLNEIKTYNSSIWAIINNCLTYYHNSCGWQELTNGNFRPTVVL
mgnify:CR=1 FL=1